MPEYHILRGLLALSEGCLFARLLKTPRLPGWYLWLFPFLIISAISHGIPAFLDSDEWWRHAWGPLAILRLGFGMAVTGNLYLAMTRGRIYRREQILLGNWAAALSGALVLIASVWHPENLFQTAMVIRQYVLVLLSFGSAFVALYLIVLRPVFLAGELHADSWLWIGWLYVQCLLATAVKGGLAWIMLARMSQLAVFHAWLTGRWFWRTWGDCGLFLELLVVLLWLRVRETSTAHRGRGLFPRFGRAVRPTV